MKSLYRLLMSMMVCLLFVVNIWTQPNLTFDPIISSGLTNPLHLAHAGDGTNRLFIVEKAGAIKVFDQNFASLGTFVTVTGLGTTSEQGLLSMAFHPQYASNGFFFVFYAKTDNSVEIARYKVSSTNANLADAASKVVVLNISHPFSNHNGGEMHFGKDGYLYLSVGDGGSGGDPGGNGQNTATLLGKLLRISVNTSTTAPYYTIPGDNPFGNLVYAYGLRNPFRWSFDRYTEDMWLGDVGQSAYEEVNYRKRSELSGTNFGWNCYEGNINYTAGCNTPNTIFPVHVYQTTSTNKSVIGGQVYRGYRYPAMKGYYFGIEYFSGLIHKIIFNTTTNSWNVTTQSGVTNISDIGENEVGELFALRNASSGVLYRVTQTSTSPVTTYTFIGEGDWNLDSNWANNSKPPVTLPSNAHVVIKPRNGGVCNKTGGLSFNLNDNMTVEPGKTLNVN